MLEVYFNSVINSYLLVLQNREGVRLGCWDLFTRECRFGKSTQDTDDVELLLWKNSEQPGTKTHNNDDLMRTHKLSCP